jgi:hypothetical protein
MILRIIVRFHMKLKFVTFFRWLNFQVAEPPGGDHSAVVYEIS